jgi:hypothetical protein
MAQATTVNPSHPRLDDFRAWLAGSELPPAMAAARKLRWRGLAGGEVNLRVRVTGETPEGLQHWFVRFACQNSTALGTHLTTEAKALRAAAAAGLAPTLVHVDEALGILVSDWWPGRPWRWRQARRGLEAFATLAARLHALPVPAGLPTLHPATAVRQLLAELSPLQETDTLQQAAHRAMLNALERAATFGTTTVNGDVASTGSCASAMSTPVFATSPTTSAVLLIIDPVVYPKMERICEKRGPKMDAMVFNKSPKIVKIFMPKNERESNTNNTIIMVLLSIPAVESEFIIGCCIWSIIIYLHIFFANCVPKQYNI